MTDDHHPQQGFATTLRSWFTTPPRAHGDLIEGRTVGFLELFYDLVFVVLIAQIAHTFAGQVSWTGFRDFAIVFALVWIAWINGSFYHELHGREDGRSRSYIFAQMALLVVLSTYSAHAAEELADGRGFAIVYAILLTVIAGQWFALRKHDTPVMAAMTTRYVIGMAITIGIIGASIFVQGTGLRLALWGAAIALTVIDTLAQAFRQDPVLEEAFRITESIAERFGLFTIIVLGEVVVGVADGLAEAGRDGRTITTGVIALTIGFGFWWNYFDLVGQRQPAQGTYNRGIWTFAHLPMWLSIAAAGAGMVSLIEHANDGRTPPNTAWLISGATCGTVLSLAAITTTMPATPGGRMGRLTLTVAAVASLALGALRPSPIVLAIGLNLTLSAVWLEAFARHARAGSTIGAR